MEELKIDIAEDFSPKLGGRWKSLGPFSGEEFYESILLEKFKQAQEKEVLLHVYMDGVRGYGSSFLDQSFGELGREYGIEIAKKTIVFHTQLFQWNVDYINEKIWVNG